MRPCSKGTSPGASGWANKKPLTATLERCRAWDRMGARHPVCTIGHSTRSIPEFTALLVGAGVNCAPVRPGTAAHARHDRASPRCRSAPAHACPAACGPGHALAGRHDVNPRKSLCDFAAVSPPSRAGMVTRTAASRSRPGRKPSVSPAPPSGSTLACPLCPCAGSWRATGWTSSGRRRSFARTRMQRPTTS